MQKFPRDLPFRIKDSITEIRVTLGRGGTTCKQANTSVAQNAKNPSKWWMTLWWRVALQETAIGKRQLPWQKIKKINLKSTNSSQDDRCQWIWDACKCQLSSIRIRIRKKEICLLRYASSSNVTRSIPDLKRMKRMTGGSFPPLLRLFSFFDFRHGCNSPFVVQWNWIFELTSPPTFAYRSFCQDRTLILDWFWMVIEMNANSDSDLGGKLILYWIVS